MRTIDAYFAAAALMVFVSGAIKLVRPERAAATLATLLPIRRTMRMNGLARVLGLVELGVGAWSLWALYSNRSLSVAALSLGGLYIGFTIVLVKLMRSGAATSCGCFGSSSAPASRSHVVVNSIAVVVAVVVIVRGVDALPDGLWLGGMYAVTVALLAYVLAMGPTLWSELVSARSTAPTPMFNVSSMISVAQREGDDS